MALESNIFVNHCAITVLNSSLDVKGLKVNNSKEGATSTSYVNVMSKATDNTASALNYIDLFQEHNYAIITCKIPDAPRSNYTNRFCKHHLEEHSYFQIIGQSHLEHKLINKT